MTLDFSCSFKTKVSFSRYQIRLLTPLQRASMHSCSLSIQVFYNLSTLCFLYDWARSNQQGSLTQGAHRAWTWCICTPRVKGSLVYWTCSFKRWSMWSWDLNNWAGEFQQRKQVFCGKSNSEAAQPLLVSVSHGTDFTQNCTSHKCLNHCITGFSSLLSRTIKAETSSGKQSIFQGLGTKFVRKVISYMFLPHLPFWHRVQHLESPLTGMDNYGKQFLWRGNQVFEAPDKKQSCNRHQLHFTDLTI